MRRRPYQEVLTDIKNVMQESEIAREFFSQVFLSWNRKGASCQLHQYDKLDAISRSLFLEMLEIKSGYFEDEKLYQFEHFCKVQKAL